MPRPGRAVPRLEPLEPRDTPALIGLEAADQPVAATAADEQHARIAMRPDGTGFVVVYDAPDGGGASSQNPENNPDRGVFFRLYDADWNPVGGPVAVNTYTTGTQDLPAVGMDAAGNFVVAWESFLQVSDTSLYDIYARRFNADGSPIDAAEFLVNTASAGDGNDQKTPAVGVNAAGQFVVAWWGGAPFFENVYAKGYVGITGSTAGGSGSPTETFSETQVNTPGLADTINPSVAVAANGSFVVAYQSMGRDGGTLRPNLGDYGVYIRRMNDKGSPIAADVLVNTVVQGDQQDPDVAMDAAGNTVVVWDSPNVDGSGTAVVAQRYAADGTTQGGNVTVNTATTGDQRAPRVAWSQQPGTGGYVVVWEGAEATTGGTDVYYRTFDASGVAQPAETLVNAATADDGTAQTAPAVAIAPAGDFVVPFTTAGTSADAVLRRIAEAPVVTFTNAGDSDFEAVTDRPFTVTRSGARYVLATTTAVTVARTGGTTQADGSDYTGLPQPLTFTAGVTSLTGHVTVVDDTHYEPDETLTYAITPSARFTTGATGSRTITIVNDDVAIGVAVSPAAVSEDSGTPLVYTFTRLGPSAGSLTVAFAVGGAGVLDTDYTASGADTFTASGGTVTFGPGETTKTVSVTPVMNQDPQPDRDVTLTVTPQPGYESYGSGTATGTILDDDMGISVEATSAATDEGGADLVYTFTRTGNTAVTRTVSVAVGGTADYGADYTVSGATSFTATAATVTFAAGADTVVVRVTPLTDAVYEGDETVVLTVAPGLGYADDPTPATGTIHNTTPAPTLTVGDVSRNEADGTATFQITLTGATAVGATVQYATADGTAVSVPNGPGTPDFTATNDTLMFPASAAASQTLTVTVSITNDLVYEPTEEFYLDLFGPTDATIATARGTATITDDDPQPTLSVDSVGVSEKDGFARFTVTLTGATALPVSVHYATADGTAVSAPGGPGAPDYTETRGDLTFNPSAAASQTLTIDVPTLDDSVYEPTERFFLDLSAPTNATITAARGTGTITDDDPPPTLTVGDVSVNEADGTATFTVTLTGATAVGAQVQYATADGTAVSVAGGPGTPDFTAKSGTLTFPASAAASQTLTVTVPITNDQTYEAPTEAFYLDLSGATDATIATARGTATIADDDPMPTLAVDSVGVSEKDGFAVFSVTLTGATALPVSVHYATADGTAVSAPGGPGTPDFTAAGDMLTFDPSGSTTQFVRVPILDDAVHEAPTEAFYLDLSGATDATIATARGTATITDDDPLPNLSVDSVTLSEADGTATFTVTLTGATALPVSVQYATADGTAVSAGTGPGQPDYTAASGTLNFGPSALATRTQTVTVSITNDQVHEPTEQFFLDLSSPTNATITTARGTGTVTDDDPLPTVSLAAAGSPFAEDGGAATVTATLSNPSAQPVTIDLAFAGTAPPAGYAASATRITVPAGSLSGSVTLTGVPDGVNRADQTVVVSIAAVTNGAAGSPASVTVVRRDTDPPAAVADGYAATENRPLAVAAPGVLGNDAFAPGSAAELVSGPAHGTLALAADGGFTYTPAVGFTGPDSFRYRVTNPAGLASAAATVTLTVAALPDRPPLLVGGFPDGSARVYAASGDRGFAASPAATVRPFGSLGVELRTATADVDGDGTPDLILVTGPGTPIRLAVVSGRDNATLLVAPFDPFGGDFTGGGFVTAADLDGDGRAEFAVSPDQGGGPRVSVFSLLNGAAVSRANFFGIDDPNFRGGARAALGDVNHDGTPDVVVSAGFLGGPRTAIFDGRTVLSGSPARLVSDFFAFPGSDATTLRNGVYVAAGDVDGDGFADLVFGGGPGGAPRVFVLSGAKVAAGDVAGAQAAPIANFFVAGNSGDRGGVRVAVKPAASGGGVLAVGSGQGTPGVARVYTAPVAGGEPAGADVYDLGAVLAAGVFVG